MSHQTDDLGYSAIIRLGDRDESQYTITRQVAPFKVDVMTEGFERKILGLAFSLKIDLQSIVPDMGIYTGIIETTIDHALNEQVLNCRISWTN